MRHRVLMLVAVIAGATALAVPAAMGAGNEQPANWLKVANSAQLVAPISVYVTITYSCLAVSGDSSPGTMYISVEEGQDTTPAFGNIESPIVCDDKGHTQTFAVPGADFTPGTGLVFATVCGLACGIGPYGGAQVAIR
jgi:hypothetical protein